MQFDTPCWWLIVGPRSRMSLAPINCKSMSKRVVSNAQLRAPVPPFLHRPKRFLHNTSIQMNKAFVG
jgi:hypothetical protein